jgi:glycosyltransferase involved in cell wall biosynthesis
MKVLIDGREAVDPASGGRLEPLLDSLLSSEAGIRFTVIERRRRPLADYPGVRKLCAPCGSAALEFHWVQSRLLRLLAELEIDLYHAWNQIGPPFSPVPTILQFRAAPAPPSTEPEACGFDLAGGCPRQALAVAVRRAARIVVPSQACKIGIAARFQVRPEKITVIYDGLDPRFGVLAGGGPPGGRLGRLPEERILALGEAGAHGNLDTVLRVFARLRRQAGCPKLVILGEGSAAGGDLLKLIRLLGLSGDIFFHSSRDVVERARLYNGSRLLLHAPAAGGSPGACLEAMACGVPVVASSSSALAEVAGAALLLRNPKDSREMLVAAAQALWDEPLKSFLRRRGLRRAQDSRREAGARKLLELYRSLAAPELPGSAAVV